MSGIAFSPNGMVMDFLRSCYTQNVKFVKGDETQVTPATWYFSKPTAKPFPGEQSFTSPTWDTVHPTETEIGFDATAPRLWSNGKNLNHSAGTKFAGSKEYFLEGQDTISGLPRGVNDTPVECIAKPTGVAIGGSLAPIPTVRWCDVPFPLPIYLRCKVTNSIDCKYYTADIVVKYYPTFAGFPGGYLGIDGWYGTYTVSGVTFYCYLARYGLLPPQHCISYIWNGINTNTPMIALTWQQNPILIQNHRDEWYELNCLNVPPFYFKCQMQWTEL